MNRKERQRYAAKLEMVADSGVQLSGIVPCTDGWTCDCFLCELLRAGVCLSCAARMTAQSLRRPKAKEFKTTVCSGACREAVERYHEGAENER